MAARRPALLPRARLLVSLCLLLSLLRVPAVGAATPSATSTAGAATPTATTTAPTGNAAQTATPAPSSTAAVGTPTATPTPVGTPPSRAAAATSPSAAAPSSAPLSPGPTGEAAAALAAQSHPTPKAVPLTSTGRPVPKRLKELGIKPENAVLVNTIVVGQGGLFRVTKIGSDTSCYAGTLSLYAPSQQTIWQGYGDYPEGNPPHYSQFPNGSVHDLGFFNTGQQLVFSINPYTQGAVCLNQIDLSTDTNYAEIYQTGPDSWVIFWEDHPQDPHDIDFNDLVIGVDRTPRDGTFQQVSEFKGRPLPYQQSSADPVNTFTGNFPYTHADLAIPGRGPSPAFARTYNSADSLASDLGPSWTDNYNIYITDPADGTNDRFLVGPDGRADRYHHNPDGSYTPPPAVYTTLVQNADHTYTATTQDQTTWSFDGYGRLVKIADRYGNASTLTYNAKRQLASVSDPAGRGSLTFAYDPASGLLTSVTDWASPARSVQFGYDTNTPPRLHTVTDRNGKTTTYGYDGTSSRLTTIVDANGHTAITLTYDGQGRVQTQKDAMGLTTGQPTTFSYPGGTGGTTTVTYPATSFDGIQPTVADTYDAQGRLTQRVSHPSASETYTIAYTYDSNFNPTTITDGRGNTTTLCWDVDYTGAAIPGSRGNLTRTISPPPAPGQSPLVTLMQYDGKNNLLETVAPKGVSNGAGVSCSTNLSASVNALYATDNAYDAQGVALLSTTARFTDPDLGQQTAVTKYEYGDASNPGRVTRIIPPRGNTGGSPDYSYATTMAYVASGSQAGMLQTVTDPLGDRATYASDPVGRKTSMVDPLNHTWSWAYDNEDRVTSSTAPGTGGPSLVTQQQFDPVGNRTVLIDANGQVTKYLYDVRDALQEVDQSPSPWTDPSATPSPKYVTTFQYDNLGNRSRATRAAGDSQNERATDEQFDGLNRLRKELQYPSWPSTSGALVTQHSYDANGNQTALQKPDGTTINLTYDAVNRWTARDNPQVSFSFDADGNRLSMVDPTGTTSYAYDEQDRLLSVTSPGSPSPSVVGYRYDLDGDRRSTIYPDSTSVAATFDKADRLTQLADWANRHTTYAYFPDGLVQQVTNVDGSTAAYAYDNARRLTQVSNQVNGAIISQHTYTLDAVGNRTQASEILPRVQGTGGFSPFRQGGAPTAKGTPTPTPTPGPAAVPPPDKRGKAGASGPGKPAEDGGRAPGGQPPTQGPGAGPLTPSASNDPWAWGFNGNGRLGDGTTTNRPTPFQISGLGPVASLAGGRFHSLAAKQDGTAWGWGYNGDGEVGDGTTTDRYTPTQVSGLSGAVGVAGGDAHSLAAKGDGTVWAWGWNGNGQLGDGTTNQHTTPVQVSGLSNVTAVAAGGWHSLALKSDGTVWAWGFNGNGELGDGTTTDRHTAFQVPGLSNIVAIAAGRYDSFALKNDGTLWAWGYNGNGALGDGTTTSHPSPIQVPNLGDVAAVSAGSAHTVVAKGDGTVWAWGWNGNGELGNGTTTDSTVPVQATGMSGAVAVAAGEVHSAALRNDGSIWAWGFNGDGELGDGTTVNHIVPQQAGGGSGMAGMTLDVVGAWHNLAAFTTAKPFVTTYGYDRLYELTSVRAPGVESTYVFDPAGNRTSATVGGATTSYAYDRADRLGGGYVTDADGNLIQGPGVQYTFDRANRLTLAQAAGGQGVNLTYDGDGNRVGRNPVQLSGGYQYSVTDVNDVQGGLPAVLQETQSGQGPGGPFTTTWKFVRGPAGVAYAADQGGSVAAYQADGLGSVRAITNGSGAVVQTYRADAFGVVASSQGGSLQPFGFAGEPVDPESGLVALRALPQPRARPLPPARPLCRHPHGAPLAEPLRLRAQQPRQRRGPHRPLQQPGAAAEWPDVPRRRRPPPVRHVPLRADARRHRLHARHRQELLPLRARVLRRERRRRWRRRAPRRSSARAPAAEAD